jgi:putative nucleotidyltransferase with HDIG domain
MTETAQTGTRGMVLFVDDEENILKSLQRLFLDDDFEMFIATSGQVGLEILGRHSNMGVIVSDQRMPGMTGVEFLEQSRAIAPGAIRILLTGYADINAAVDAVNLGGIFRYLHKPWQDEELRQTVQGALQFHRLSSENRRLNAVVKQQNEELKRWNTELEVMVQEQTMELQKSYDSLRAINSRLRTNFRNILVAFSGLIELRDRRMRSHSRNVAEVAVNTARTLGLTTEAREMLLAAALLHDIGKIGISDLLLQKEVGELTSGERNEYEQHPIRGQAAIDRIEELQEAGLLIRGHHENYDGSGFPDGLVKQEIPAGARIIAIADHIDKRVRIHAGAAAFAALGREVHSLSASRFDPRLVPVVLEQAELYYRKMREQTDRTELELSPNELREGMELSRDVFSGTGILLISRGTILAPPSIMLLKRYSKLDPAKQGIFVSIKE